MPHLLRVGMVSAYDALLESGGALGWATVGGQNAWSAWDFIANEARWANAYVGGVASTPNWTFSRASTGYALDSSGVLQSFSSGALRRTNRGVLIEGARTNLCLQSQTFDNASWTKTRSSVSADATAAPDGTLTADKLVEDNTASNTHRVQQSITVSTATAYTYSIYAKAGERTWISFQFTDGTGTWFCYFNLGTGVKGTSGGSPTATGIDALGNGWYRCWMTMTTSNTAGICQVFLATADGTVTYSGDNASGVYLWGAQLE